MTITQHAEVLTTQWGRHRGDQSITLRPATFTVNGIEFKSQLPTDREDAARINAAVATIDSLEADSLEADGRDDAHGLWPARGYNDSRDYEDAHSDADPGL